MADYRISNGVSSVVAGTGTVSFSAGFTAFAGVGTAFLTQLHAGDLIIVASAIVGSVASVSDNVNATLTYASASSIIGQPFSIDPLVVVNALNASAIDPLGSYYRWALTLPTGDALERALGRPHATWYWKNIAVGLRTALLTYCASKSARVYIRTLVDPNLATFATYQAAMLWPDGDYAYNPDFSIEFRDLVAL